MNGEPVDLLRRRLERELAEVRRMNAEMRVMLDEMEAERRRNERPPRPRLYLVE